MSYLIRDSVIDFIAKVYTELSSLSFQPWLHLEVSKVDIPVDISLTASAKAYFPQKSSPCIFTAIRAFGLLLQCNLPALPASFMIAFGLEWMNYISHAYDACLLLLDDWRFN